MAELLVVDTGQQAINFAPATVADEIEQNVRMIISTPKGTVALDRDFGIDYDLVDQPTPGPRRFWTWKSCARLENTSPAPRW